MVTDPIADFLTRIRNAQMAGHRVVDIPASNLKKRMTEILYAQGYILKYKFEDDSKQGLIKIALKFFFIRSSNLRCRVRLYKLLAVMAHELSQARSDMENEPSRYFIQCQKPVGINRVSPCSSMASWPSTPSSAGNFLKSGCSIS